MMKTKSLLSIAIIAALPITAMAENISGAMYTAPSTADTNHPAPTTYALAPYGRIDIDTADQEHIATTAYVKGAYNSAIAAVNTRQGRLYNDGTEDYIGTTVVDSSTFVENLAGIHSTSNTESELASAAAMEAGIKSQRVEIYTTWDDDDATTDVAFKTVVPED